MKVEEKIIAYWAINESIVKILVGAILLFDNSRGTVKKDVDYDMKKGSFLFKSCRKLKFL